MTQTHTSIYINKKQTKNNCINIWVFARMPKMAKPAQSVFLRRPARCAVARLARLKGRQVGGRAEGRALEAL